MDTTQNVLQKSLGTLEYAKLLDGANRLSIFGEPVKELSRDELLAALTFTLQANKETTGQQPKDDNFNQLSVKTQKSGLW